MARYYIVGPSSNRPLSKHGKLVHAKRAAAKRIAKGRMRSIDVVERTSHGDYVQGRVYRDGDAIVWSPV